MRLLESSLKRALPKSTFARQVLTLMTGTGLAQTLPIAAAPILTRLYQPSDYGAFALFMAITGVLSIFSSGRYELAILLPADDSEAANLTVLAITLSLSLGVVLFFVALFFNHPIASALGNESVAPWLYFVPVTVVTTASYQAINFWFNRQQDYRRLALNRVSRSSITVLSMLGLGIQKIIGGGLILGTIIGQVVATGIFGVQAVRQSRDERVAVSRSRMRQAAARYVGFPKYSVPADSINALSAQMPIFVLTTFFGPVYAGYFGLTQRVLGAPLSTVATAFADVFKQRASRDFNAIGNCRALWVATFKRLLLFSILPFLILAFTAPPLFALVFGPEWREAGHFAQLMSPYFLFAFTASPLSRTLYVAEKQQYDLLWQIALALFTSGGLLLGAWLKRPALSVLLFAGAYTLMYMIYLRLSYRFSGGTIAANTPEVTPGLAV